MLCGIYGIQNTVNGKLYVGQSKHMEVRWKQHERELRYGTHHNDVLQNAWNKYGESNFVFVVLQRCSETELDYTEVWWVAYFQSHLRTKGYNLNTGGGANRKVLESTREKLSLYFTGRRLTPEHRARIAAGGIGRRPTEETRARLRAAQAVFAEDKRKRLAARNKARVWTEEARKKCSDFHKQYRHSEEVKRRIGASTLGKKRSAETKLRMSLAQLARRAKERVPSEPVSTTL